MQITTGSIRCQFPFGQTISTLLNCTSVGQITSQIAHFTTFVLDTLVLQPRMTIAGVSCI